MAFHNPLNPPARSPEGLRRTAQAQFAPARGAKQTLADELADARDAADANTAKLRALRLMKQVTDAQAAALAAANAPPPKPKKPRPKFILG
ncbi:MAG TPA: hypothetical protein VHZ78_01320 [Rhizomicrobium sp.]|jgi:hypothetical protein|nr:hypothetical protein [Rhizomicrobium sp.]